MIEINKNDLGVLDSCTPYVATYMHDGSLSEFIKSGNSHWITINSDKINSDNLYLLFVNHINFNFKLINVLSRSYINQKFKSLIHSKMQTAFCTIKGLYINGIIFVKDRYKSTNDINIDIKSSDSVLVNHLKVHVHDLNLIGTFDLKKCNYFCKLS